MPELSDRESLRAQAEALLAAAGGKMTGFDFADGARSLARALVIFREIGDERSQALTLTKLGNFANNAADYAAALDYLHEAEDLAVRLGERAISREARGQLILTHALLQEHATALTYAERELLLDADDLDAEVRLLSLNVVGCVLAEMGRHDEGVARIVESMALLDEVEPPARRTHLRVQSLADLSDAYRRSGNAVDALALAEEGMEAARRMEYPPLVMLHSLYAGRAAMALGMVDRAARWLESAAGEATRMGHRSQECNARLELAGALEALGRHGEALTAYRRGHAIEKEIRRDEALRRIDLRHTRQSIEDARRERESAERVLFAVLPQVIATRVKGGEARIADELPDVSVLIADLVGFTAMSTRIAPRELLDILERIFSEFDRLTSVHGVEKVKTIGDAYMTVGGALTQASDHLERSVRLGLDMIEAVRRLGGEMGADLSIRIGLHSGPVIAGVIGAHRLSYDLWGETVNLASRLESTGVPSRIHVSGVVAERLSGSFATQARGVVLLKGFGELPTFLLS